MKSEINNGNPSAKYQPIQTKRIFAFGREKKNKTLMNGHKLYNKIHYEGKDEKITSSRKKIGR